MICFHQTCKLFPGFSYYKGRCDKFLSHKSLCASMTTSFKEILRCAPDESKYMNTFKDL